MILYTRKCQEETLLVIANMSSKSVDVEIPAELTGGWKRILTNYPAFAPSAERKDAWKPWECEVYVKEA
jgi:hypothetical protein